MNRHYPWLWFDADGTLFDYNRAEATALRNTFHSLTLPFEDEYLGVYRQINHVRLHAQWDAMKEKILTGDVIADYNRQHRGIFNALNERDAQSAYTMITEHLEKARDDLVKANSP